MLKPDDKTPDGIFDNVGKIIRVESGLWTEMRNRSEPLFELKPEPPAPSGLGLSLNNWQGKVTVIVNKLCGLGYPALSSGEITALAIKTHPQTFAQCNRAMRDAIQKKLQPSIADRMIASISGVVDKVTGRS